MVALSCYVPPGYSVARGKSCLEYVANVLIEVKRRYTDPYIVVMGDFNQWDLEGALEDFPELTETHHLNTRGNRSIDRVFSNFNDFVREVTVRPPLESDDGDKKSDHLVVLANSSLPRREKYEVLSYSYHYYTEESAEEFMKWVVLHDWKEVLSETGSNNKANAYQSTITSAVNAHFQLITTTQKSSDPPWLNARIRRRIRQRKAIFKREGRSAAWKRLKKVVTDLIKRRREIYGQPAVCIAAGGLGTKLF